MGKKIVMRGRPAISEPIQAYRSRSLSDVDESPNNAAVGLIWPRDFDPESKSWDTRPLPELARKISRREIDTDVHSNKGSPSPGRIANGRPLLPGNAAAAPEVTLGFGDTTPPSRPATPLSKSWSGEQQQRHEVVWGNGVDEGELYGQLLMHAQGVRKRKRNLRRRQLKEEEERKEYEEYLRSSGQKFIETIIFLLVTALGWTMLVVNVLKWHKFPFHQHPFVVFGTCAIPILVLIIFVVILDLFDSRHQIQNDSGSGSIENSEFDKRNASNDSIQSKRKQISSKSIHTSRKELNI